MGPSGEMISGVDQDTKLDFTCVNSPSLMAGHFVSAVGCCCCFFYSHSSFIIYMKLSNALFTMTEYWAETSVLRLAYVMAGK